MATKTLAAILAATTVFATTALADQTQSVTYRKAGPWEIRVDGSLGNSCYMTTNYGASVLRISYDNVRHGAFINIWNPDWKAMQPGVTYDIVMQVDNAPALPLKASALSITAANGVSLTVLGISFNDPQNLMGVFGVGNQMHLTLAGRELGRYDLNGTAVALNVMNECNVAYGGPNYMVKADPFQSATPTASQPADPFKRAPAQPAPVANADAFKV